jgi:predicted dehydrogenase
MEEYFELGIWGVGSWAKICMDSIAKIPTIHVVACYDSRPEAAAFFASKYGCAQCQSEEEFLTYASLDAVALLTPNHLHCEQALKVLQHGLHLFIEKPMTNSLAEAEKIIEAEANTDRVVFIGHNNRRESRFRFIRKLLKEEAIGSTISAQCIFTSEAGLGKRLGGWRYDPAICPVVPLSQIGIHALDTLAYLLSPIVQAQGHITASKAAEGFEDLCHAQLVHENGVVTSLITSYTAPRRRSVSILGTKGMIISDTETEVRLTPIYEVFPTIYPQDTNDTVREEYEEFAQCCLYAERPETNSGVGYASTAVMNAILESHQQGGLLVPVKSLSMD